MTTARSACSSGESTGEVSLSELFDAPADIEGLAMGDVETVGRMAFLAVITASGYAYRRGDGVYVIPISCLAP